MPVSFDFPLLTPFGVTFYAFAHPHRGSHSTIQAIPLVRLFIVPAVDVEKPCNADSVVDGAKEKEDQ